MKKLARLILCAALAVAGFTASSSAAFAADTNGGVADTAAPPTSSQLLGGVPITHGVGPVGYQSGTNGTASSPGILYTFYIVADSQITRWSNAYSARCYYVGASLPGGSGSDWVCVQHNEWTTCTCVPDAAGKPRFYGDLFDVQATYTPDLVHGPAYRLSFYAPTHKYQSLNFRLHVA